MVITILNALDDALNYHNIKRHPQRISKLKPYINKYNYFVINISLILITK